MMQVMMRLSARLSLAMFFAGCSCLPAQSQESLSDLAWLAVDGRHHGQSAD
jgi:hypothetical protein